MLNFLWAGMIIVGVIFGVINGKVAEITNAALDSSKEAVSLCITMMGVMSMWVGLMEVAKEAGIIEAMSRRMGGIVKFLFPQVPDNHPARAYIITNMIANFLGLGWAATPAGLKAMEELSKLEEEQRTVPQGVASNAMCTFLIINISSLQLIPVNIIAYRSQYGSVNPAAVVGPGILATAISTLVAVGYCKWKDHGHFKRR